ncbi:MAG: PaaX domain-containing protein, C- domain protein [Acidimicrobiales bacterium]
MNQARNIPLTARSVLASTLLGADPPELPVAHLVHMAGLFGINGNRARVALSRMVAAHEATTDGSGRYRLAGRLLDRRQRQQASRAGQTQPWSGEWRIVAVTVTGSPPEVRARRRHALAFARLAELREGIWMRPANVEVRLDEATRKELTVVIGRLEGDSVELVGRLWDVDGWDRRAHQLIHRMEEQPTAGPSDLAAGFELSASILRHLQADPLLPGELLRENWPGLALRDRYDEWDAGYRSVLEKWSRNA